MDLRRLRAGEWIAAIPGVVLVVSLFLPWYTAGEVEITAFEAYSLVDVLLLAIGLLAIALLVVTAVQPTGAVGVAADALLTLVGAIVVVVAVIRAIDLPAGAEAIGGERALFLWIGLASAGGVLAGAAIAMRDERLSRPGRRTDATGVPSDAPPEIETLPAPRRPARKRP